MIVITGGAGFLGSNLAAALDERGTAELVVCDRLGDGDKWRNLAKRELARIIPPEALLSFLADHARAVEAVFHLGAVSSTTERDADLIIASNFTLSLDLWEWCTASGTRLVYASSAATYGDGGAGFADDAAPEALAKLRPINAYGWSKHLFDRKVARLVARRAQCPPQWVGLKFFNVYGPNEYHKDAMKSVAAQIFPRAQAGERCQLFRSHRDGIADGEQKRDFVYVRDAVAIMLWLFDNPEVSGLYNVGTGKARSFRELAEAIYRALGREPALDYIDMPMELRDRYQYFTEAKMDRLAAAGYDRAATPLEEGVGDYVRSYLTAADPYR